MFLKLHQVQHVDIIEINQIGKQLLFLNLFNIINLWLSSTYYVFNVLYIDEANIFNADNLNKQFNDSVFVECLKYFQNVNN